MTGHHDLRSCNRCGATTNRRYCSKCRKQDTTPRRSIGNGPSAQMDHANSPRARKKAREGAAAMARTEQGGTK